MLRTFRRSVVGLMLVASSLLCVPCTCTLARGSDEWPLGPPALESGDVNGDWTIDIGDPLYLLGYLFLRTSPPVPVLCNIRTSSGDANGDGSINVSDCVYLLKYLFTAGPSPVPRCEERPSDIGDIALQILQEPPDVRKDIRRALEATVPFRTPEDAQEGGLVAHFSVSCVDGLGIPLIDEEAYGTSTEPSKPAICYFAPGEKDEMRPVALEWVVLEESVATPPTLFGQPMAGPTRDALADFGIPSVYYRQMHLYKHNPDGLLAAFNPITTGLCDCGAVFCPN